MDYRSTQCTDHQAMQESDEKALVVAEDYARDSRTLDGRVGEYR